jgi:ABC-type sugar transport system substrate-binding protein
MHGSSGLRAAGATRRDFLRRVAAGSAALPLSGLLAACGEDEPSGAGAAGGLKKMAFSHSNSGTPVVDAVQRFAGERADKLGIDMLFGNPELKVEAQVREVETWITQRVPAICVFPVVVDALEPFAQRARDDGLIFTSYAVSMKNASGAVLFSHEQSGRIIGEHAVKWVNEHLGGKAKVLLLGAGTASPDLQARIDIPKRLLTEQTEAKIVAEQDGVEPTAGLQVTETVLRSHPDLDVVIGLNDDGALGAMRAFINAGKDTEKCYIGGQDGGLEALKAIKDGGFYKATAALSLRDIGYGIVDLNSRLAKDGGEGDIDVPPRLIAQDETGYLEDALAEWR